MSPKCIFPERRRRHPKANAIKIGPERSVFSNCSYWGFSALTVIMMRCLIRSRSIPMSLLWCCYLREEGGHRLRWGDLNTEAMEECFCITACAEGWNPWRRSLFGLGWFTPPQVRSVHCRKDSRTQPCFSPRFSLFILLSWSSLWLAVMPLFI